MKFLTQIIFIFVVCVLSISAQQNASPSFEDYPVSTFKGKIHAPKWIKEFIKDVWQDDLGKGVEPLEINFAGKYYVSTHSCGTGCRYYTMTDLSSGRELETLNDFSSAEPLPKTFDGREYLTILYYRPESKMLIAQYLVGFNSANEQCRERAFIFDGRKIKPITKTKNQCRKV